MIELRDVSFKYAGNEKKVLENLNLTIRKGEFVAIAGNNGAGKSTLCKLLNGLIPNFTDGDIEGAIFVDGIQTSESTVADLAGHIGYVYQDFENQIIRPKVLDDVSFGSLNCGYENYLERGREALEMTGLSDREQEYIWQLSGGQKHLLALAGVIAMQPNVLILDEPIAQLDPYHSRQIYDVLKYFNQIHGKTILVIEHDAEFIADYCDSMLFMNEHKIQWKLPVKEALKKVEELLEGSIYPPQPTRAASILFKRGVTTNAELPVTMPEAYDYFSTFRLEQKRTEKQKRSKPDNDLFHKKATPLISFQQVSFSYERVGGGRSSILERVDLDIFQGDKIALIGNNGAGKSTLLRLMMGLLKPDSGKVLIKGQDTAGMTPEEISALLSYIYQKPEAMFIEDCIEKDIAFSMKARKIKQYKERTKDLLQRFNLTDLAEKDGRLLSGGQMRRASLAIGIALSPPILLLDEPTASLDMATRKTITETLTELKETLETTIIATHDMQLVAQWANRIVVLHEGMIIKDGTRDEVFEDDPLMQQAGIQPPDLFVLSKMLGFEQVYTVDEFVSRLEKGALHEKEC